MDDNFPLPKGELNANFRPRVILNKVIHIKRSLQGKGKVLVNFNEEVKPHDIIGKSVPTVGYTNIDIAKHLSIQPSEVAQYLQRKLGSSIYKGELLAYKKGIFSNKVVVSPTDCVLESLNPKTGELRCKILTHETSLTAGVYGIVEGIDKDKGQVLIKTQTTQIFGVIGSGVERGGILTFIPGNSSTLIQKDFFKENMDGYILTGGAYIFPDALKKAIQRGVAGIVTGGIDFDTFQSISGSVEFHNKFGEDVGISMLVTEGFGAVPIGQDIYKVLQEYEAKFVLLDGNASKLLLPSKDPDSILSLRKISLPLKNTLISSADTKLVGLKEGDEVRVIWPPFMGTTGKVISMDKSPSILASGISTYMVTLETVSKKIKVPYTNIEIIK